MWYVGVAMRRLTVCLSAIVFVLLTAKTVFAADIPLGFHLLEPGEIQYVLPYRDLSASLTVTVPMVLTDRRTDVWQSFFETCAKSGITPIIRWVTLFENGSWGVPTKKDIVDSALFLRDLHWSGNRILILFNEPNQAKEWGGKVDPEGYAEIATFAAYWLKSEPVPYAVLPAGLDAAAPNNHVMIDSLKYIDRMYKARPELFDLIDGWTSHSYPNPDFSASAYKTGKNSLRGYEQELHKLKMLTGREYAVYITETGWRQSKSVNKLLPKYYQYAVKNIWNKEQIKAVTVFLLRGFSGPFAEFSLLDADQKPTVQMKAFLDAAKLVNGKE